MKRETEKYIHDLVHAVETKYNIRFPKSNVFELVERMNGTIQDIRCEEEPAIIKTSAFSFVIQIPKQCSHTSYMYEQKERMTAMYLGHLMLHLGFMTNADLWNSLPEGKAFHFIRPAQVQQASLFADCLRMPEEPFISYVRASAKNGIVNIQKIASQFHVSPSDVIVRGRNLGIITC